MTDDERATERALAVRELSRAFWCNVGAAALNLAMLCSGGRLRWMHAALALASVAAAFDKLRRLKRASR